MSEKELTLEQAAVLLKAIRDFADASRSDNSAIGLRRSLATIAAMASLGPSQKAAAIRRAVEGA